MWVKLIYCDDCRPQYSKKQAEVDKFAIEYFLDWSYETSLLVRSLKYGCFPKEYSYLPKFLSDVNSKIAVAPASHNKRFDKNHAWCLARALFSKEPIDILEKKQEQKALKKKNRKELTITSQSEERFNSVIFVDDVVTTGATVKTCYKALKEPEHFKVVSLVYVNDLSKL